MGLTRGRIALAATVLTVAACGVPTPGTASSVNGTNIAPPPSSPPPAPAALSDGADAPAHLSYPGIGVDADLHPTGLDARGAVRVPPLEQAGDVDYLDYDREFGKGRPIVTLSHVNGRAPDGRVIPGGFLHLSGAKVGDRLTLAAASGRRSGYRVVSVKTVPKTAFPTSVYAPRPEPTLIMITCGGTLDHAAHSFDSNVIATAVLG